MVNECKHNGKEYPLFTMAWVVRVPAIYHAVITPIDFSCEIVHRYPVVFYKANHETGDGYFICFSQ
jgi:hypothetical protein